MKKNHSLILTVPLILSIYYLTFMHDSKTIIRLSKILIQKKELPPITMDIFRLKSAENIKFFPIPMFFICQLTILTRIFNV